MAMVEDENNSKLSSFFGRIKNLVARRSDKYRFVFHLLLPPPRARLAAAGATRELELGGRSTMRAKEVLFIHSSPSHFTLPHNNATTEKLETVNKSHCHCHSSIVPGAKGQLLSSKIEEKTSTQTKVIERKARHYNECSEPRSIVGRWSAVRSAS